MSSTTPPPDLYQDCLAKLNRALDLVLKSAETASAEGNHKVVIQAAREVTRIVTLITKITDPKGKSKPPAGLMPLAGSLGSGKRESAAPFERQTENGKRSFKSGKHPPAGAIPNLKGLFRDSLFQPDNLDDLDPLSLEILQDIMK